MIVNTAETQRELKNKILITKLIENGLDLFMQYTNDMPVHKCLCTEFTIIS